MVRAQRLWACSLISLTSSKSPSLSASGPFCMRLARSGAAITRRSTLACPNFAPARLFSGPCDRKSRTGAKGVRRLKPLPPSRTADATPAFVDGSFSKFGLCAVFDERPALKEAVVHFRNFGLTLVNDRISQVQTSVRSLYVPEADQTAFRHKTCNFNGQQCRERQSVAVISLGCSHIKRQLFQASPKFLIE